MNELSNWIPDNQIIAPKEVDHKFFRVPRIYVVFLRTECPKEGLSKPLVVFSTFT